MAAGLAGAWFGLNRLAPSPALPDASRLLFAQQLPDGSGTMHDLSTYRGQIVVVNFWATWCPPCVKEIPEFSRVQKEFAHRNVRFVGLGIDSAANVARFAREVPTAYPLLVAGVPGTELARQFGNAAGALPYTVILGKDGVVQARKLGTMTESELRGWLQTLTHSD